LPVLGETAEERRNPRASPARYQKALRGWPYISFLEREAMEGWVPRMRVWTGGYVSGVVVVGVGVGVLLLPEAMAAACG